MENGMENQSWLRHVQLRGELGRVVAYVNANSRHIECSYRREIRKSLKTILQCLDDINSYEPESKDKE